ncbi:MAG TPA: SpvB/TcaC N-terminal domain-containing protein [Chitinophagaceae bacterium]|nr:SpvB/TcaC N-terminal domain-containing protein [Chitinophagaceae bacterium]
MKLFPAKAKELSLCNSPRRMFSLVNFLNEKKYNICLKILIMVFIGLTSGTIAKGQEDTATVNKYIVDKSQKHKTSGSVAPNVIPPGGGGCIINGTTSATGGNTYTYFLSCGDGSFADYWEVTCGIAVDWDYDYVTITWNSSGCTNGTIKARKINNTIIATKTVTINPPPPPTISYTPLFTSSNFIKTIDLTKPVGTVDGSADASGAVTYTIPIFSSPGTNGVQPSVSISYNSQASAGVVGYGWNISGLSIISRSGKNIYNDRIVQPVNYTTADGFVLDGMRLNPITGSNGANGTVYAGEAETFAKIISNTTASANNPDWFQVIAKDGSVLEFGRTADSRIKTDNGLNVMFWRLNRSIDINGNYIDYVYDNTGRDSRIKTIKYTGNINTGLIPSNFINFNYALKTDQNTMYDAGGSISAKYLLSDITIIADIDKAVKTYVFNYGFDNINSFLKEIIEKGTDGTALNSTIFLYGDQPQNLTVTSTNALTGSRDLFSGDYDEDGKTDLFSATKHYDQNAGTFLYTDYSLLSDISNSSSTIMYQKSLPQNPSIKDVNQAKLFNFLASDFNGDGRDDILQVNTTTENINCTSYKRNLTNVIINLTKGFNNQTGYTDYLPQTYPFPTDIIYQHQYASDKGNFIFPGDFDGDGNQDYILVLGKKRQIGNCNGGTVATYAFDYKAFMTSPGTNEVNKEILNFGIGSNPYGNYYSQTIGDADLVTSLDIDGDGKTELLVTKDQISYIISVQRVSAATGYSFAASTLFTTAAITKDSKYYTGDFNGDHKTDLLVQNINGSWNILYSTGTSFISASFTFLQTFNLTNDKITIGDFNGDGKSDILHGYPIGTTSTSKLSAYYSRGVNGSTSFYNEQYTYNNVISPEGFVIGDFNGDGRSDLLNRFNIFSNADFISIKPFGKEKMLVKVTNGHNVTTAFDYKLLTDKSTYPYFYNRIVSLDDPANKNPYNYVQLPLYVASSITFPNGIGGTNTTTLSYEDALMNRSGKGFLGFQKITSKNTTTGITTITQNSFNTSFAVPFTVNQKTLLTATSELLSESQITNSFVDLSTPGNKGFLQKIDKVLNINYLNGTASENVNTYDSYGNVTTNVVKTGTVSGNTVTPVETTTTTTTYGIHNTPVAAKPDQITVSNLRAGFTSVSKTSQFTYTTSGLIASQIEFAGLPKAVTTSYIYNGLGNATKITVSSTGLNSRVSNITYDTKGAFPFTKQITGTGLSQTESSSYEYLFGNILSQTSSDCLTTTFQYDAFGRLKKTILPQGFSVNTSFIWDVQGEGVFYLFTDYPGGKPDTKIWKDKLGRSFKSQTAGFNNQWLTQLNTYDAKGNVLTGTNNYFPSEAPIVTTNAYDVYNRLQSVSNPLNTITSTYTRLSGGKMQVVTQDVTGLSTTKIADATGKIVTAIDKGGQLDYIFDSRGNQTQIKHGANTLITNTYDSYGRQATVADVNAGTVTYVYDAFSQLTQQTDNNGNAYTMQYDDFGRITSRQGTEGTTSYLYYKDAVTGCSNNNLSKVTGFNGIIKDYAYDTYKRLQSEMVNVDATAYTTQYNYDTYSNLTTITYPSGVVVNNAYDINGELATVTGGNAASPTTLFTGTAMNGFGNYSGYTLGNGKASVNTYTNGMPVRYYTPLIQDLNQTFNYANGNLLSRRDAIRNITETFQYDALNRLTKTTVNTVDQLTMSYDGSATFSMGNIASKTDAGNYVYKTDKLHAVAYITNPAGAQTPPANISVNSQVIAYTPFLKTASITESTYQMDYTYGADYDRVKSILKQNSAIIETKYYLDNYEKKISGGVTTEVHYVSGGNGLCAMIVSQAGVNTFYFVYTDQLGSILTVTDIGGTKVAEQNFDAWGRNRNPVTWQYASVPANPVWLYRGYTGHEHVPQFALINMNGRMYDPIEGRMLSPDNYISDPFNTQGYNRYTYAMNNPLVYTDPDGNNPLILVGIIVGAFLSGIHADMQGKSFLGGFAKGWIVGAAGANLAGALAGAFSSWGLVGSGIAQGAITGLATGGLNAAFNGTNILKGSLSGALWGGIIGGAMGAINRLSVPGIEDSPGVPGGTGDEFTSDNELDEFINKNVGNLDDIQTDFKTKISLATESNLPKGYSLSNGVIYNEDGKAIDGLNIKHGGWFSAKSSSIRIAPGVKGTTLGSGNYSQMVINHELLHAYHWNLLPRFTYNHGQSEHAASMYSFAYAKAYNAGEDALNFYRSYLGYYPDYYSWRELLKHGFNIKLGIK